jgi:hypothetical protein
MTSKLKNTAKKKGVAMQTAINKRGPYKKGKQKEFSIRWPVNLIRRFESFFETYGDLFPGKSRSSLIKMIVNQWLDAQERYLKGEIH